MSQTPRQWNCPYCGFGEYKNHEDWERRAADHIDRCEKRSPEEAVVPSSPPGDEIISLALSSTAGGQ